jgi:hypothetical protein
MVRLGSRHPILTAFIIVYVLAIIKFLSKFQVRTLFSCKLHLLKTHPRKIQFRRPTVTISGTARVLIIVKPLMSSTCVSFVMCYGCHRQAHGHVISGFRCGVNEVFTVLVFHTAYYIGSQLPTFRDNCFALEDGTDRLFRNVGNWQTVYAAEHPKRPNIAGTYLFSFIIQIDF